jgi:hypothetical protein
MVRVCYGPGLSSPILLWSGFVKSDFVMVRDVMESDCVISHKMDLYMKIADCVILYRCAIYDKTTTAKKGAYVVYSLQVHHMVTDVRYIMKQ